VHGGKKLYDIRRDTRLADVCGAPLDNQLGQRLSSLGTATDRQEKISLRSRGRWRNHRFPGFSRFTCDLTNIAVDPIDMAGRVEGGQRGLSLVCKETGKQYIGSAKGEESLWLDSWTTQKTGHGGISS